MSDNISWFILTSGNSIMGDSIFKKLIYVTQHILDMFLPIWHLSQSGQIEVVYLAL